MQVWSLQTGFQKDPIIYFYIHEIISLWLKGKTLDSEFHILAIKLKITVYNDIDSKRNEYALTGLQRPQIFQSTKQPVLTNTDRLKPVLTTGPVNMSIDWSFANLVSPPLVSEYSHLYQVIVEGSKSSHTNCFSSSAVRVLPSLPGDSGGINVQSYKLFHLLCCQSTPLSAR